MITDYYSYQQSLAKEVLLPAFKNAGLDLSRKTILDIGCGQGGVLNFLSRHYSLENGLGLDIDSDAIHRANEQKNIGIEFKVIDFTKMKIEGPGQGHSSSPQLFVLLV